MQLGTVRYYSPERGFGFVWPESGGASIFVHFSVFQRAGSRTLRRARRSVSRPAPIPAAGPSGSKRWSWHRFAFDRKSPRSESGGPAAMLLATSRGAHFFGVADLGPVGRWFCG